MSTNFEMNMYLLLTLTRYTVYKIMSWFSVTNGLHMIIHKQSTRHPEIDFPAIIKMEKLLNEVSCFLFGDKCESRVMWNDVRIVRMKYWHFLFKFILNFYMKFYNTCKRTQRPNLISHEKNVSTCSPNWILNGFK